MRAALLGLLLPVLAGCGGGQAAAGPRVAQEVAFTTCPRTPATDAQTRLRPVPATATTPPEERGAVVREHLLDAVLADGRLDVVAGPTGVDGGVLGQRVADDGAPVSVTAAVLEHPQAGRRLAFLEVQVDAADPVRWEEAPELGFVTDGGDGALLLGPSRGVDRSADPDGVRAFRSASAAVFGNGDRDGTVCALRRADGDVDGVYFLAGYGDGGYATFVGRDAEQRVVSVVHTGDVLPWSRAGLPGPPPPGED